MSWDSSWPEIRGEEPGDLEIHVHHVALDLGDFLGMLNLAAEALQNFGVAKWVLRCYL